MPRPEMTVEVFATPYELEAADVSGRLAGAYIESDVQEREDGQYAVLVEPEEEEWAVNKLRCLGFL